jgi:hypothetical protein
MNMRSYASLPPPERPKTPYEQSIRDVPVTRQGSAMIRVHWCPNTDPRTAGVGRDVVRSGRTPRSSNGDLISEGGTGGARSKMRVVTVRPDLTGVSLGEPVCSHRKTNG